MTNEGFYSRSLCIVNMFLTPLFFWFISIITEGFREVLHEAVAGDLPIVTQFALNPFFPYIVPVCFVAAAIFELMLENPRIKFWINLGNTIALSLSIIFVYLGILVPVSAIMRVLYK